MVKLPDDILVKIAEYICGDTNKNFPYRTGSDLSLFFGSVGLPYSHDGKTTRKWWVLGVLKQLNDKDKVGLPSEALAKVIEYIVAPHNSESQRQQIEQILVINRLIKQFRLELAIINEERNVLLFYYKKETRQAEYYGERVTVISDKIQRVKKNNANLREIDSTFSSLKKQGEESIQILTKIDRKIDDFSHKTDTKLDSIKEDTEQILKDTAQLEAIFDKFDDLEGFLIKNLASDFRKIKYAWDQYKEGKITKKELAKECVKALGRQTIKRVFKL